LPLKKPAGIPKIPKTRKKKSHSALTAIPSKKPDKLDYTCKAYFKYDFKLKKQFIALCIETISEFTSFSYEISVDVIREKNVINIVITGLKAKMNAVPSVQPAKRELLFEDLIGELNINVVKQDGAINSAEYYLNIYSKEILLRKEFMPKKKNNRLFCKFEIDRNKFSFEK
jgi:hypothetical protein